MHLESNPSEFFLTISIFIQENALYKAIVMNKFDLIADQAAMPIRINSLPELCYSERLNSTSKIFDGIIENGWFDRAAYYCNDQNLTYAGLISGTKQIAGALQSIGVGPEDRVIMRMGDTPEFVMTLLAIIGLGAIAVPTFIQLKADELSYRIKDSGSRFIVVDAVLLNEVEKVQQGETVLEQVIVANNYRGDEYISLEDLAENAPAFENWANVKCDDICLLLYTSGTSGRPKGAVQCHRDLMSVGDTLGRYMLDVCDEDIFAGPVPLPFAIGTVFFVFCSLRFGAAVVLCPEKSAQAFVNVFKNLKPTIFISVPTFYHRLLDLYRRGTKIQLQSVRTLLCAGEPLNPELELSWKKETGLPMSQLIGTTEMFNAFVGFRPGIDEILSETLGKPCAGYEITVRDPETFEEVATGEHGLMCVRGPSTTVYWSPREVQSEAVRDGWTIVQDLIWKDDDGFVHFVSRYDEMIITAGINVAPIDVERILASHEAVAECACIGAPDNSGERSEIVKAFVILAEGYTASDALSLEMQKYFKDNGPPSMYPREIEFVPALPRSLAGKILRSVLKKEEIEKRVGSPKVI
jgi:2-aminobenzoate-CoA ligase